MDRDRDRTDGLEEVDEESGLDRLELQTDGLDALRLLRLLKDPLELGEEREKLRLGDVERNDRWFRLRVRSMPAVERPRVERREPSWTTLSRVPAADRDANLEARPTGLENSVVSIPHTRTSKFSGETLPETAHDGIGGQDSIPRRTSAQIVPVNDGQAVGAIPGVPVADRVVLDRHGPVSISWVATPRNSLWAPSRRNHFPNRSPQGTVATD